MGEFSTRVRIVRCILSVSIILVGQTSVAQDLSVARQWNEKLLKAITRDFARPPVQARNLYHISAAMYEAWAAYDPKSEPFLLGRTRAGYVCPFDGVPVPADLQAAREEAMSHAAYRMIVHRFQNSPGIFLTMLEINDLMATLGYNTTNTSVDYIQGGAAELGNYIATQIIAYGMQDGSYEQFNFSNQYYSPINTPLVIAQPGNPNMADPNRWQQLTLALAIDQQGNPVPSTPPFQSPEWGNVDPFGLHTTQMSEHVRNGHTYKVYLDPGDPAYLDTTEALGLESFYKWNFCMVPIWQSHLDPNDGVMIDISPASKGNLGQLPQSEQEIRDFYQYFEGGDPSTGHALNPITGEPYAPQVVKRGDYARILAEFWADGPNSETPPGHWFSIMHTVMDHPLFERKWMGEGDALDELEYDVKAHLALGGALHDAAITAWGIKGWYDYVRPVSAIRYMASKGQCSDPQLPNFHPAGLPLIPGHMEQVTVGDPLAGAGNEHVGKVKLYTWQGPDHISDPLTDIAGVDWILAENWFPYQRPTFVTPPFAGYISGHSTYSRTAAEVLTAITGTPYFPGGMSNFLAPQNDFLVFEQGPSEDIYLQWATYQDASDQCSLSRIWGGIHPPIDDIPGRALGMVLGPQAVDYANTLFNSLRPVVISVTASEPVLNSDLIGSQFNVDILYDQEMNGSIHPTMEMLIEDPLAEALITINAAWISTTTYRLTYELQDVETTLRNIHFRIDGAVAAGGSTQDVFLAAKPFEIDTERPVVLTVTSSTSLVNNAVAAQGQLEVQVVFNEACDTEMVPLFTWTSPEDLSGTLILDPAASEWIAPSIYKAVFQLVDNNEEIPLFGLEISNAFDAAGNQGLPHGTMDLLVIDTREPVVLATELNNTLLNLASVGAGALVVELHFDEEMDMASTPTISFVNGDPLGTSLVPEPANSLWLNATTYRRTFSLLAAGEEFADVGISVSNALDLAGNSAVTPGPLSTFLLDTKRPDVTSVSPSTLVVSDALAGTATFTISLLFDEPMQQAQHPGIQLIGPEDVTTSLIHEPALGQWTDPLTFVASYSIVDEGREVQSIGISYTGAMDLAGNQQIEDQAPALFDLDTRNPELLLMQANTYTVTDVHIGTAGLQFVAIFDEAMDQSIAPVVQFSEDLNGSLIWNENSSTWLNASTHRIDHDVMIGAIEINNIAVTLALARDLAGNPVVPVEFPGYLSLNITAVGIEELTTGTFNVYPNPCRPNGTIWLELERSMADPIIRIHDTQGKLVHSEALPALINGRSQLSLPTLAGGSYLMVLEANDLRTHARLVIME